MGYPNNKKVYNQSKFHNGEWKDSNSDGDYSTDHKAKTFRNRKEFYYINFLDENGYFDSTYSEHLEDGRHAKNRAQWLARRSNKWALSQIPYRVDRIGLYTSRGGYIASYKVELS